MPHDALKTLYYTLIHSHLQYGIQLWGNATDINALTVLPKRAIRIINKSDFSGHTEPPFKYEEILKISDLHKLHVFLFIYNLHSDSLPKSCHRFIPKKPVNNANSIVTRQHSALYHEMPRTTFSSKLPKHRFTNIWNSVDASIRNETTRKLFKHRIYKQYLDHYKAYATCTNLRCHECHDIFVSL